ncbi:alpha amylase C-terminal domain-containing protein [Ralstonia solanacearum]|uniref:1,4-alpha-glucan branching enzyme n=3 Tax=Ralstonia solanacearum TaxID=305 RepID=F6G7E2_RALS8|nr:alpha amylase C-terminal domain-containing protein [Ralstonia solanacearum]AEG70878.1 1,4-alpha-glucan branching enzyme [Ralstonia solanacearum Po82]AMP72253.1 hypothetical protein UW163_22840 [Ralstonia solanacearum]AMP76852.1 hypothetical protein RALBFv3_22295 [Ralstonia solanacearum]AYB62361.1 1,4-alpha-glucan-branching protein [Ralstonia solanacearum]MBB6589453.1 alpha amylase C-terminal domain-containing protein [Ralstonia solanacearum]
MSTAHGFATPTRPATPAVAAPEPPPALPPGLDRNALDALTHGRLGDPFAVLGPHRLETADGPFRVVRAFHPGTRRVQAIDPRGQVMAELAPVGRTGLFHGQFGQCPADAQVAAGHPGAYRLRVIWPAGTGHEAVQEAEDPYAFGLLLGDLDLHLIVEGRHWELALHARDCAPEGFGWVIGDDRANSVFAYLRFDAEGTPMLVAANMTPVPRDGYRIGVPDVDGAVRWREVLNTDSAVYGGTSLGNGGVVDVEDVAVHGWRRSVVVRLPPLAVVVLKV